MTTFFRHGSTAIYGAFSAFFTWWTQELLALIPPRLRPHEGARLEIRKDNAGYHLKLSVSTTPDGEARLQDGILDPMGSVVIERARRRRFPVWLFLPADCVLSRHVEVPASATGRFEVLLRLEIDRWSPYKFDEVYATWEEQTTKHETRREMDLRIAPRATVNGLCAELAAAQLYPQFLMLGETNRHRIDLGTTANPFGAKASPIYTSIFLAFLALVSDWIAAKTELNVWRTRYHSEMRTFSSQHELQDKIARAVVSAEQATHSPSNGKVMAALADALPKTDWLTEIDIKSGGYVLRGYAENIDHLLKAIEPIAAERKINLQGEVALDSGTNRQHFSITFRPSGT